MNQIKQTKKGRKKYKKERGRGKQKKEREKMIFTLLLKAEFYLVHVLRLCYIFVVQQFKPRFIIL